MSFDSASYLLFLPSVLVLHRLCPRRGRWAVLLLARLFSPWDVSAGLNCLGLGPEDGLRLALTLALLPGLERLGWDADHSDPMTCVYAFLAIATAWLIRLNTGGAGTFIYFQF